MPPDSFPYVIVTIRLLLIDLCYRQNRFRVKDQNLFGKRFYIIFQNFDEAESGELFKLFRTTGPDKYIYLAEVFDSGSFTYRFIPTILY